MLSINHRTHPPVARAVLTRRHDGLPPQLRLQSFQSVAALLRGAQADPTARLAAEVLKEVAVTPVVGVLLQSCLAAAQQEVAAGGGGSKELRAAALQTLCLVVQVVGSADALAFFVPGERLRQGPADVVCTAWQALLLNGISTTQLCCLRGGHECTRSIACAAVPYLDLSIPMGVTSQNKGLQAGCHGHSS